MLSAVLALAGAGLFASAAPANAQSTPAVAAATTLVFDINGTYTDGGSARPVISNVNDVLTVNMSSQNRPTATGVVINSDTILITFPDDGTYTAKLQAPGTIRWSNSSTWTKITTRAVPSVRGRTVAEARPILIAAGFVVGATTSVIDLSCNFINTVKTQSPAAGTLAIPGTAVRLSVGREPPGGCTTPDTDRR